MPINDQKFPTCQSAAEHLLKAGYEVTPHISAFSMSLFYKYEIWYAADWQRGDELAFLMPLDVSDQGRPNLQGPAFVRFE